MCLCVCLCVKLSDIAISNNQSKLDQRWNDFFQFKILNLA